MSLLRTAPQKTKLYCMYCFCTATRKKNKILMKYIYPLYPHIEYDLNHPITRTHYLMVVLLALVIVLSALSA